MIAPLTAPHIPPVRATPLQNPVAILGIKSDWMPWLSAIASNTLSAQKKPDLNSSRLRCGVNSLMFQAPRGSYFRKMSLSLHNELQFLIETSTRFFRISALLCHFLLSHAVARRSSPRYSICPNFTFLLLATAKNAAAHDRAQDGSRDQMHDERPTVPLERRRCRHLQQDGGGCQQRLAQDLNVQDA